MAEQHNALIGEFIRELRPSLVMHDTALAALAAQLNRCFSVEVGKTSIGRCITVAFLSDENHLEQTVAIPAVNPQDENYAISLSHQNTAVGVASKIGSYLQHHWKGFAWEKGDSGVIAYIPYADPLDVLRLPGRAYYDAFHEMAALTPEVDFYCLTSIAGISQVLPNVHWQYEQ